jgi:hypothetical protein
MITYSCRDAFIFPMDCTLPKVQDFLTGATAMSQISKIRQSRNQWRRKAVERAEENRYLRKDLARVKRERDRLSKEPKDPEIVPP